MADVLDHLKGALSDRYAIKHELGRGGMATVYLAQDLKHDRQVAIKVLRPELASTIGAERFLREIEIAARLTHPHILTVHDSGRSDGLLFYVTPFIEGESLRRRLDRERQLPLQDALSLTREVASALSYAHDRGVIHRDIKPENILLSAGGAVVADFGVARAVTAAGAEQLTETGIAVGTPVYMSPEQASGETQLDGRSDIYSLGCVFYEMLGGEPPHVGTTPQAVIARKIHEPAPCISVLRDSLPKSVEITLQRALAKTPADRLGNAAKLLDELDAAMLDAAVLDDGVARQHSGASPRSRRSRSRLGIAVALVVVLAAASIPFVRGIGGRAEVLQPQLTQLTYSGNILKAELSPDGEFLAFIRDGQPSHLLVRDLTGGTTLEIGKFSRLFTLRWSPDGSSLLVSGVDSTNQWVSGTYPRLGGELRSIADCCHVFAAWSPDGTKIAHWTQPIESSLKITGAGTTRVIEIPESAGLHHQGDWSPNGRFIALGTRISAHTRSMIWVVDVERETWLLLAEDRGLLSTPRWSVDGDAVYYFRGDELCRVRVSEGGAAISEPEVVRSGLEVYLGRSDALLPAPSFASSGAAFVFVSGRHFSNLQLATVGRSGEVPTTPLELTHGTARKSAGRFSPDGEWVAFVQYEGDKGDIFVTRVDGSDLRQITHDGVFGCSPAWSRDGSQLACAARGENSELEIVTVEVATGRWRRYPYTSKGSTAIAWAPSDRILYGRQGNRNFHFLDTVTEVEQPLVTDESVGWMFTPQISPDGESVAIWWNRGRRGRDRGTWTISLSDSSQRLVRPGIAYPVGYSPDGSALYVEERTPDGWRMVMVHLASGEISVLGYTPIAQLYECVARDAARGVSLLCSVDESDSDVWLVQDFDGYLGDLETPR